MLARGNDEYFRARPSFDQHHPHAVDRCRTGGQLRSHPGSSMPDSGCPEPVEASARALPRCSESRARPFALPGERRPSRPTPLSEPSMRSRRASRRRVVWALPFDATSGLDPLAPPPFWALRAHSSKKTEYVFIHMGPATKPWYSEIGQASRCVMLRSCNPVRQVSLGD
jgi:hypothetical protein